MRRSAVALLARGSRAAEIDKLSLKSWRCGGTGGSSGSRASEGGNPFHRCVHGATACRQQEDPKPVPLRKLKDSFLDGTSSSYLEELEERYRSDPKSVDTSWASFFRSMDLGVAPEAVAEAYDSWEKGEVSSPLAQAAISNQTIQESQKFLMLVRAYQILGHHAANLDPLGLSEL